MLHIPLLILAYFCEIKIKFDLNIATHLKEKQARNIFWLNTSGNRDTNRKL